MIAGHGRKLSDIDKEKILIDCIEKRITKKEASKRLGISVSTLNKRIMEFKNNDGSINNESPDDSKSDESLTEDENLDESELSPKEYFENLKGEKRNLEESELNVAYSSAIEMYEGFIRSNQTKAAEKLKFIVRTLEKEYNLYKLGVRTYVYRQDIARFIENVSMKVVKVIDLESYERPIPDEIKEVIELTNGIFSKRVIVFTDYTGEVERKVEKERREKDPILFGIFDDNRNHPLSDRFYFLGDWEDDMCDLTLESVIDEMQKATHENISHDVTIPQTIDELKEKFDRLNSKEDDKRLSEEYSKNPIELVDNKLDYRGPVIDPNDKDDHREYREKNIGEYITTIFKNVRSILGRKN